LVQALWLAWAPSSPKAFSRRYWICAGKPTRFTRESLQGREGPREPCQLSLGSKLKMQTTLEGYGNE